MRDKIKLKARSKKNHLSTEKKKNTDFSYENIISQKAGEIDENLQKRYNEIIVKYIYYLILYI